MPSLPTPPPSNFTTLTTTQKRQLLHQHLHLHFLHRLRALTLNLRVDNVHLIDFFEQAHEDYAKNETGDGNGEDGIIPFIDLQHILDTLNFPLLSADEQHFICEELFPGAYENPDMLDDYLTIERVYAVGTTRGLSSQFTSNSPASPIKAGLKLTLTERSMLEIHVKKGKLRRTQLTQLFATKTLIDYKQLVRNIDLSPPSDYVNPETLPPFVSLPQPERQIHDLIYDTVLDNAWSQICSRNIRAREDVIPGVREGGGGGASEIDACQSFSSVNSWVVDGRGNGESYRVDGKHKSDQIIDESNDSMSKVITSACQTFDARLVAFGTAGGEVILVDSVAHSHHHKHHHTHHHYHHDQNPVNGNPTMQTGGFTNLNDVKKGCVLAVLPISTNTPLGITSLSVSIARFKCKFGGTSLRFIRFAVCTVEEIVVPESVGNAGKVKRKAYKSVVTVVEGHRLSATPLPFAPPPPPSTSTSNNTSSDSVSISKSQTKIKIKPEKPPRSKWTLKTIATLNVPNSKVLTLELSPCGLYLSTSLLNGEGMVYNLPDVVGRPPYFKEEDGGSGGRMGVIVERGGERSFGEVVVDGDGGGNDDIENDDDEEEEEEEDQGKSKTKAATSVDDGDYYVNAKPCNLTKPCLTFEAPIEPPKAGVIAETSSVVNEAPEPIPTPTTTTTKRDPKKKPEKQPKGGGKVEKEKTIEASPEDIALQELHKQASMISSFPCNIQFLAGRSPTPTPETLTPKPSGGRTLYLKSERILVWRAGGCNLFWEYSLPLPLSDIALAEEEKAGLEEEASKNEAIAAAASAPAKKGTTKAGKAEVKEVPNPEKEKPDTLKQPPPTSKHLITNTILSSPITSYTHSLTSQLNLFGLADGCVLLYSSMTGQAFGCITRHHFSKAFLSELNDGDGIWREERRGISAVSFVNDGDGLARWVVSGGMDGSAHFVDLNPDSDSESLGDLKFNSQIKSSKTHGLPSSLAETIPFKSTFKSKLLARRMSDFNGHPVNSIHGIIGNSGMCVVSGLNGVITLIDLRGDMNADSSASDSGSDSVALVGRVDFDSGVGDVRGLKVDEGEGFGRRFGIDEEPESEPEPKRDQLRLTVVEASRKRLMICTGLDSIVIIGATSELQAWRNTIETIEAIETNENENENENDIKTENVDKLTPENTDLTPPLITSKPLVKRTTNKSPPPPTPLLTFHLSVILPHLYPGVHIISHDLYERNSQSASDGDTVHDVVNRTAVALLSYRRLNGLQRQDGLLDVTALPWCEEYINASISRSSVGGGGGKGKMNLSRPESLLGSPSASRNVTPHASISGTGAGTGTPAGGEFDDLGSYFLGKSGTGTGTAKNRKGGAIVGVKGVLNASRSRDRDDAGMRSGNVNQNVMVITKGGIQGGSGGCDVVSRFYGLTAHKTAAKVTTGKGGKVGGREERIRARRKELLESLI